MAPSPAFRSPGDIAAWIRAWLAIPAFGERIAVLDRDREALWEPLAFTNWSRGGPHPPPAPELAELRAALDDMRQALAEMMDAPGMESERGYLSGTLLWVRFHLRRSELAEQPVECAHRPRAQDGRS